MLVQQDESSTVQHDSAAELELSDMLCAAVCEWEEKHGLVVEEVTVKLVCDGGRHGFMVMAAINYASRRHGLN